MNYENGKICRLCLSEGEVMCPIFSTSSKNGLQGVALPQRIMCCAQIRVVEDDGLPAAICHQCLAQVDKSYQFKLLCEKSDATLRQNLQDKDKGGDTDSVDGGDAWEVMKFTPEVIINEGESEETVDQNGENHCDSDPGGNDTDVTSEALHTYPLSEVQALLRHHGTELKLQGDSKARRNVKVLNFSANGNSVNFEQNGDGYQSLYGVEAILNNDQNDTYSSSKSRRSRDGQKLFQCRLCPKSYSFSSALSRHKAVHNTALRPYVCVVCKKGFAEPEKLERHTRTHLVDQTYHCDACGRVFKALATYERHLCGLGFSSRTKLKMHPCSTDTEINYNDILTGKGYPCPLCGKLFNKKSNLDTHMGMHTGDRPFCCTVCGKGFRQKVNLIEHHQRKHTQARPYICDVCSYRFVTKQDLIRHYRKHFSI